MFTLKLGTKIAWNQKLGFPKRSRQGPSWCGVVQRAEIVYRGLHDSPAWLCWDSLSRSVHIAAPSVLWDLCWKHIPFLQKGTWTKHTFPCPLSVSSSAVNHEKSHTPSSCSLQSLSAVYIKQPAPQWRWLAREGRILFLLLLWGSLHWSMQQGHLRVTLQEECFPWSSKHWAARVKELGGVELRPREGGNCYFFF